MKRLYNKIKESYTNWLRNITWKQVLFFTVFFVLFVSLVLPWVNTLSEELIGVSDSIDTGFKTDIKELYHIRELYGVAGRLNYIYLRVTFDLIWPIIYFLFLASTTALLTKNITESNAHRYLNYLPIIAILLDYFENVLAIIFMAIYPGNFDILVFILIVVSLNKWVWIGFAFLQIIYLSLVRSVQYVRK